MDHFKKKGTGMHTGTYGIMMHAYRSVLNCSKGHGFYSSETHPRILMPFSAIKMMNMDQIDPTCLYIDLGLALPWVGPV